MNFSLKTLTIILLALISSLSHAALITGTIFQDPDIITSADYSFYSGLSDAGQADRVMFDRRSNSWITNNAFLFDAAFSDGLNIEVQVNSEFGNVDAAREMAAFYLAVIGQLPTVLRSEVETVWLHKGVNAFGGGNNNLLIHTGQGELYQNDGILEETFFHEAAHTSLDGAHSTNALWLAAQSADGDFISTYAQNNPDREDIAESILPYYALKYKRERISDDYAQAIVQSMSHRMAYFDAQNFNLAPTSVPEPSTVLLIFMGLIGMRITARN